MVTHTVGLEDLIARELSVVPETEQVLVSREGDNVLVWSVVNNVSDEARCRIYEREMVIMRQFPDLPFQVIDRSGDVANAGQRLVKIREHIKGLL